MALAKKGMTLVSAFQGIQTRDFPVTVAHGFTNFSGTAAAPLVDGEFLSLDVANAGNLTREGDLAGLSKISLATNAAAQTNAPAFCVFSDRGRYDTQAIAKATVLFIGNYEADFKVYNGQQPVGDWVIGQRLCLYSTAVNAASNGDDGIRTVLGTQNDDVGDNSWDQRPTAASFVYGYVIKAPTATSAVLRAYMSCAPSIGE